MSGLILTLNAGSSSLKVALYSAEAAPRRIASGEISGIGGAGVTPHFIARFNDNNAREVRTVARDHDGAFRAVIDWLRDAFPHAPVAAIGHRIVHGGLEYAAPTRIDEAVLAELAALAPLAPLHQPHNLAGVVAARAAFPKTPQIGCFDTAFHRGHDFVNDAYALPRRYYDAGLRRFGFHGLSYEYIARRLRETAPALASGRVVAAHLGAGASLCAMLGGRSVACSMGFSPLDGLPMATRCGAVDPGILLYLLNHEKLSGAALGRLLYEESGLKGLSGLTGDMREIEALAAPAAREAFDYFAHRLRVEIAGCAATLDGLDALVFTAGIGEHSARLRAAVLKRMAWLGLHLDSAQNDKGAHLISPEGAVPVLVIPTDEELMIALHVSEALRF